ncbi:MAG: NADP-dependent isocitrate dehydrogenase [Deltaproteobacteria bacterium]|nr:NADP-dependent isocitrate dehydrogenase [Deltaproteobacteria bacterium]
MTDQFTIENGLLRAGSSLTVPVIVGDGVGPDIWRAAEPVLMEAAKKGERTLSFFKVSAGEESFKERGEPLPTETLQALRDYRVSLKGPLSTPVGGGLRSLNVTIRQALDLYACVRPVKWIDGSPSPVKKPEKINMVIFRENTEDVYSGFEWPSKSEQAKKLIKFLEDSLGVELSPEAAIGLKPMTEKASKKLIRLAITQALAEGRPSVTLVHKGNIMKHTEGAFKTWGLEVAREEFKDKTIEESEVKGETDKLIIKDRIADNMFMQSILKPEEYSVLAMPNLNGDYLSDALAGQIGGLGLAPGANVGDQMAVFEATHGTAPNHAGKDLVNPSSLILSAAMLFDFVGWEKEAASIRLAIEKTIKEGIMTYDLARQLGQNKSVACSEFGRAVAKRV